MATNTLIYAFPMETSVTADATYKTWSAETITIPETTGRVFRSAILEIACQDVITATGGTIDEFRIGMNVASVGWTDLTITNNISNTGENMSVLLSADFVQQFIDNFGAGPSQTVQARAYFDQSTGTTLGMRNLTAVLYITYEFTGTPSTRAKTVIIPLESKTTGLGTSLTEIGTNQIPILIGTNGFIKEASPTILDYFFIMEGNEALLSTTDFTPFVALDSESEVSFGTVERALSSERLDRFVWSRKTSIPSVSTVHAFKARSAGGGGAFKWITINLVVTYSYDEVSTSRVTNSIWLPLHIIGTNSGYDVTGNSPSNSLDIYIEEPGTIELLQSAVQFFWTNFQALGSLSIFFAVGSQTQRDYSPHLFDVTAGMFCLQQRFDSGSVQGAGISISRGKNTISVRPGSSTGELYMSNLSCMIILNYASNKHVNGTQVHNHTTIWNMFDTDVQLNTLSVTTFTKSITISETNYWVNHVGFLSLIGSQAGPNIIIYSDNNPRKTLGISESNSATEYQDGKMLFDSTKNFIRHPNDPDSTRFNFSSRKYRFYHAGGSGVNRSLMMMVTYHSITFTYAALVKGYSVGDGSGINVLVRRSESPRDFLYSAVTATGGTYTTTVYDNTEYLVADAQETTALVGRSRRTLGL
jgi:hypothetical protein